MNKLQQVAHDFAAKELQPRAQEIDKINAFPADMWEKFGSMGFLGITAPGTFL
jgi:isovaleryl-CoA dehydrogenase